MTYQRHCSTGRAATRSASAVLASSTEKSPSRSPGAVVGRAVGRADEREQLVGPGREVAAQVLDVGGAGVELGVDAGGPHEQVVGPPQVLGQGRAAPPDEALEGVEVGGLGALGEVEEVVGDRLDLRPAAAQHPPGEAEGVLRLVVDELVAHEGGDGGAAGDGEGARPRGRADAVAEGRAVRAVEEVEQPVGLAEHQLLPPRNWSTKRADACPSSSEANFVRKASYRPACSAATVSRSAMASATSLVWASSGPGASASKSR